MAAVFDESWLGAKAEGIQNQKSKTKVIFFPVPKTPVCITGIYIHFSIGQDLSNLKNYLLFS